MNSPDGDDRPPTVIGPLIYPLDPPLTGYALAWRGSWLPGQYESVEACMVAYGIVLGGEHRFTLESVRDAHPGDLISIWNLDQAATEEG